MKNSMQIYYNLRFLLFIKYFSLKLKKKKKKFCIKFEHTTNLFTTRK